MAGEGRLAIDGSPIGDPLTDNRPDDDNYPFHDVFHLAHAAISVGRRRSAGCCAESARASR